MRIRLYFDEDAMDSDLVRALRVPGVRIITAYDVGLIALPDEKHLSWAADNAHVLYSFNVSDFMALTFLISPREKTTQEWSWHSNNAIQSANRCVACCVL